MNQHDKLQLAGWVLFVVCAALYGIVNVRSRDWLSFVGTMAFLVACLLFIAAMFRTDK